MIRLPSTEFSLWREAYTSSLYPRLSSEVEVDVAVIGAGITGLSAAYLLKQAGKTVAVMDKDTVGGGTTGRTTGKVTSQHDIIYSTLRKQMGDSAARIYGEANQAALQQIETIITDEQIDCDWQRADNYVYTTSADKVQTLKNEAAAAAKLGLPASYQMTTDLPFDTLAAVKFSNQAHFTAQKYLLGLAAAVHGNGSFVFEHTNAVGIQDGSPCHVKTPAGSIIAKDIIVATNVPTLPLMARGSYCALEYPSESYLIAAPYSGKLGGMYISPDKHHYSILPTTFEGTPYLLIGGSGHLSGLRASKHWHYKQLANYAEQQFGISTISHMWSDRDYLSYDKVPLIGRLYPWSKHLYVGTAFKKWGLTGGTVAGMILTDLLADVPNPWASVFTTQRLRPVKYIPRAIMEQTNQLLKTYL